MPRSRHLVLSLITAVAVVVALRGVRAQQPQAIDRELLRIFQSRDYRGDTFGPSHWFGDGGAYAVVERSGANGARELVAYDAASGRREVMADAALLTPKGAAAPLAVEGYEWSTDRRRALIFTNSRKVWRLNTRGDYWWLDRGARTLRQIGGDAPEASLMFAKFSPDGTRVAYVRERNIFVETLSTGARVQLTSDGS